MVGFVTVQRKSRFPQTIPHSAYRQQDEYFCARCRKRWSVSEDAPEECA